MNSAQNITVNFFTNRGESNRAFKVDARRRISFRVDWIKDAFSIEVICPMCAAGVTVWDMNFTQSWEMVPIILCQN